jgi:hypothetical protein
VEFLTFSVLMRGTDASSSSLSKEIQDDVPARPSWVNNELRVRIEAWGCNLLLFAFDPSDSGMERFYLGNEGNDSLRGWHEPLTTCGFLLLGQDGILLDGWELRSWAWRTTWRVCVFLALL